LPDQLRGRPGRAIVVGGSVSGLFAAILLARRGWRVEICERNPTELAGRGAGIVTHPALYAALRAAGLEPPDDFGVELAGRRTYGPDGALIGALDFPQITTSWDRLFQLLRAAVPNGAYRLDKAFQSLTQDGDGVRVAFCDGASAEAELVVGADGFRSALRAAFLPGVEPAYAGYVAWRGVVDERDVSAAAQAALFDSFTFCLPPGEQMLGYPIAGPQQEGPRPHRRLNFVWYRPADERRELPRLLRDDAGADHDVSIPPPLIAKGVIAAMRAAAERTLAPVFAEAVRKTAAPFLQPIYDLAAPRLVFGRVVLVGDAAFVARPHVGAGATKAAGDAIALADALALEASMPAALARFERQRLDVGNRIIARARRLGAYLQAQRATREDPANAERFRSPEAVMRETASLAFLDEDLAAA